MSWRFSISIEDDISESVADVHVEELGEYLNSRLRARTASLALLSLAEARSQTSRTRVQSSDAVAVRKPAQIDDQ